MNRTAYCSPDLAVVRYWLESGFDVSTGVSLPGAGNEEETETGGLE